jgi:hypothetical protein
MVPQIADGKLAGPMRITRLIRTLTEIPAASVTDLAVSNAGLVSFKGKDSKGGAVKVASTRDSQGRLVLQVTQKDLGMIGFTCSGAKQSR